MILDDIYKGHKLFTNPVEVAAALHQLKLYSGRYSIILGGNSAEEKLIATLDLK
jgi:hypothetical protein